MKRFVLLLPIILISVHLKANDTIIVRKDPRFDLLSDKQAEINKRTSMMTSSGLYKGFRIQVLSTTSRDQANQVKSDLLNRFLDEKTYLQYQSPYFKVRIGNFINKVDAEKFRVKLNKFYPQGVYVVEDLIEYTAPE